MKPSPKLVQAFVLALSETPMLRFDSYYKLKLHKKNPDATLSPFYLDLRGLRSFRNAKDAAIDLYLDMSEDLVFDRYADVPTAASIPVGILFDRTGIPIVSPREAKDYGTEASIDGVFEEGETILVIDDLITEADSKFKAIKILEDKKLRVRDVMVLVDREQGGRQELENNGYVLHAGLTIKQLLEHYLDLGKMPVAKYEEIIAYLDANSPKKV